MKVDGGGVSHIAALQAMSLDNPYRNWEMYTNWADSVRSFPQVTKKKVRADATGEHLGFNPRVEGKTACGGRRPLVARRGTARVQSSISQERQRSF